MRHLCAVVTCAVPSHAQAAPAEYDPVWDWRRRADDADVFKEISVNELAEQLLTVCRSPRGPIDRASLDGIAVDRLQPHRAAMRICCAAAASGAEAVHRRARRQRRCGRAPTSPAPPSGQSALHWRNARVAQWFAVRSFTQKLMMYSELKHYKYKDVIMQQGEEGSKRLLIIGAGKVKIERQVRWIRAGRCGAAVAGGAGGAIGSSACGCRRRTERSR